MIHIRRADRNDIDHIDEMLRSLSADLGDRHSACTESLKKSGFGVCPAFHVQIAQDDDNDTAVGIALYSPVFSTVIGGAGLYLSDLWVAASQRGSGLGPRLVSAALQDAAACWQAVFVKLAVYEDNPSAIAFYERLGFTDMTAGERYLVLKGDALDTLLGNTESS